MANSRISPAREENFPDWYQSVVREAQVAELDHVRGCMVIRPWGYGAWELMKDALDSRIKETGHENAYFPLFIPLSYFEREATHVDGFAKEMAVVTHHRLEADPDSPGSLRPSEPLPEPLIVRPTSEMVIGRSFAKWIQSYRDLPLLINQWANVVRWELRPRVLLRTTEFLWQEGHTAHATEEEAQRETRQMLEVYRDFAETVLAIPVVAGEKPESERFPGAVASFSIEAMMQDGKALQAGTSHYLGQNFAKAAEIQFTDRDGQIQHAYTTSWGVSTRLLGAVVMTHSDDLGLRLPPAIAPKQLVVIPAGRDHNDPELVREVEQLADEIRTATFRGAPVRVSADVRDHPASHKRWDWITKGIPVIIEVGPREIQDGTFSFTRRDESGLSRESKTRDNLDSWAESLLSEIQQGYLDAAVGYRESRTRRDIRDMSEFREFFKGQSSRDGGFVRAPWSGDNSTEEVLAELKVTVRCIPFDSKVDPADVCIISGQPAVCEAIFAKSY